MNVELKKILLVEDSSNDAELTMEALAEQNMANEVIWLRDGAAALDYLYCRGDYAGRQPVNPALILLDLKMPKVDGHQVLKEVKGDEQLKTIPIVVLTSSSEESDLLQSYHNGVNAYVVKPVNFGEFMEAVKQLGIFWALLNEPPPSR